MHHFSHEAATEPDGSRRRRSPAGPLVRLWPLVLVLWLLAAPAPPRAAAQAVLAASDDFSNPSSGWLVEDRPQRSFNYGSGVYHGRIKVPNYGAYGFWNRNLTDFDARVDVQRSGAEGKNGAVYLAFRVTESARYYAFMINDVEKWCRLVVYDNTARYTDFTCEDHIKTAPEWNALRIVAKGHDLQFYVNDVQVGSVTDSTFSSGGLGLGLAATEDAQGYEANYDNFKLYLEAGVPLPVTNTPARGPTFPSRRTATPSPSPTRTQRTTSVPPSPSPTPTSEPENTPTPLIPTTAPMPTADDPTSTPSPPPSPVPSNTVQPTIAPLFMPQLHKS